MDLRPPPSASQAAFAAEGASSCLGFCPVSSSILETPAESRTWAWAFGGCGPSHGPIRGPSLHWKRDLMTLALAQK